jgi:hypothetical protein
MANIKVGNDFSRNIHFFFFSHGGPIKTSHTKEECQQVSDFTNMQDCAAALAYVLIFFFFFGI